jgi:hypothetical protein
LLEADPTTDWRRVNIEALRRHLIDMDEVTLRADMRQRPAPGGLEGEITGTGGTTAAIRRMASAHVAMVSKEGTYVGMVKEIPGGVHVVITAGDTSDSALVTRIRGLGFMGLLTEGDHHARHHLALARGEDGHRE